MSGTIAEPVASCARRPHGASWAGARDIAGGWVPLPSRTLPIREAVGAVLAEDAVAGRPVPHYDSSAMDGWAVAGSPPWRLTDAGVLESGQAVEVVTGGALPAGTDAVVPVERGVLLDGVVEADPPGRRSHVRRAGEEAARGTVLAAAGVRLSPAQVAVLAIAGLDAVTVRARPRVGIVLTGDEVVTAGMPVAGRVRDAFDPLLPLAVARLGAEALPAVRVGDEPAAIRDAIAGFAEADLLVTVGGTGRSRADRLREALDGAEVLLDGVAMRPGHPALLVRLPDGRPLLALPGNPLAAVAVLLSFVPPLIDALTAATAPESTTATAAVDLTGWAGGTSLIPCRSTPAGIEPAPATRPNMLRGLAASAVLAVVPPEGVPAGGHAEVLPLPW